MRKTIYSISIAIFLFASTIFTSCTKDKDDPGIPKIDYILIDEVWEYPGGGQEEDSDSLGMSYNANNQLISVVGYYDNTEFTYDDQGRLVRVDSDYSGIQKRPSASYTLLTWEGNTVTLREYYGVDEPSYRKYVATFNSDDELIKLERWNDYSMMKAIEEWELVSYIDYTWTAGNITLIEKYSNQMYFKGEDGVLDKSLVEDFSLINSIAVTYSTDINPFILYPAMGLYYSEEMAHLFLSKNIPSTIVETEYWMQSESTSSTEVFWQLDERDYPYEIEFQEEYVDGDYSHNKFETWNIFYVQ